MARTYLEDGQVTCILYDAADDSDIAGFPFCGVVFYGTFMITYCSRLIPIYGRWD